MPVPCRAETSTTMVSPPQASGTSPRSDSCWSDAGRVGVGPVHLVDGHDDRHLGRLGVVDGLDGLGHHAVVGRHHEDDDVGGLGATGPHGGEGGVARRVDERDAVVLPVDLVGADVLGDAAGLPRHDVGRADAVEQQRLAVVDVPHDGDDRGAGPLVGLVLLVLVLEVAGQQLGLLLLAGVDEAHVGTDLGREELDHVVGQRLGRHDHLALQQQEAHDVAGAAVELGPEVAGRRAALDDDLAVGDGCRRGLVRGELRRLELFEVAPAPPGPALGRPPTGHAATPTRRWCTRGRATPGTAAEAAATGGTAAVAATATDRRCRGTAGAPRGGHRSAAGRNHRDGTAVRSGPAPTHAGRGRDRAGHSGRAAAVSPAAGARACPRG